jgi:hypothetical protein
VRAQQQQQPEEPGQQVDPGRAPARPRRRAGRLRVLAGVAAAVAALAVAGRATSPGPTPAPVAHERFRPLPVPLPPDPVTARLELDRNPHELAVGEGAVWVAGDGVVHRIDPVAGVRAASVPLGSGPQRALNVLPAGGAVWVPVADPGEILRIDPSSNRVVARIRTGRRLSAPVGLAMAGGALLVSCCGLELRSDRGGLLLRIDPATNRVTGRLPVPQDPLAVTSDGRSVWVTTLLGQVLQVDPATLRVVRRLGPFGGHSRLQAAAAAPEGLWLGDPGESTVLLVRPDAGAVAITVPASGPTHVAPAAGGVWLVSSNNASLSRIEAGTGRRTAAVPLSYLSNVKAVAVGGGAVWATIAGAVVRVDPARAAGPGR